MATLVLTAAATAITTAVGSSAILTGLITTAATVAGQLIDAKLFGGGREHLRVEGPRLEALGVTASTEGNAIKRVYGRVRIGGEIIWATNLEEVVTTSTQSSGGGKGGGGGRMVKTTTTTYTYYANLAVGLCEGPVGYINRAWADGKEIDLSKVGYRFYRGTETQAPDSLIESIEGTDKAPAYRGLAYIVFERLPLTKYGNRIPQFTFEIIRPSPSGKIESSIRGVNLIPGSTEFGYDPETVTQRSGGGFFNQGGTLRLDNKHNALGKSDWSVSMDQLKQTLPNVDSVCLVVSWFFDDLRCEHCRIEPRVEVANKNTTPHSWRVSGLTRGGAVVVSYINDGSGARPAFGGTPNDASVIRAIQDLKARGYKVMLYPFVMGDIPANNGLPDPYGGTEQAIFPWRGRITCFPAPNQTGSPDKTTAAASQVNAFVGTCAASHFSHSGTIVNYSGPNEWSYRRFALHMASLASAAGGVDSICIGSEMVSMTQVRSAAQSYPFVDALKALAGDVRSIVGANTKIGYAADWSEYHSHRPADGSNDVLFNMDPLWSDANIDFIGIDNYLPLADWRDGRDHTDYNIASGHTSLYELDYLKSNIEGGEYYDWYYANDTDRRSQARTTITDDAHGEHWIYRQKDIRGWWQSDHHNRPGGIRSVNKTGWVQKSKPVWFTELGCPALDKGANQPNVFYDPKSSESALPHFSNGARDDVIQRRYIEAWHDYFDPANGNNPNGTYGSPMIAMDNLHVWSWDARPFPSWPLNSGVWGDAANWQYGHWLSSRAGMVYVPDMLSHIANDYGFLSGEFEKAYGACDGYIVDRTMSLRDALSPLSLAFFFDLVETGDKVKAVTRHSVPRLLEVDANQLADEESGDSEPAMLTRGQETELPKSVRIKFIDSQNAYNVTAVEARRDGVQSTSVSEIDLPVVLDEKRGHAIATTWLADTWAARETGVFSLAPSALRMEVGDVVNLTLGDKSRELRLTELSDAGSRRASAAGFIETQIVPAPPDASELPYDPGDEIGIPVVTFLDIPLLSDSDDSSAGYIAATTNPWPGGVDVYRSPLESGWVANSSIAAPAIMGETLTELPVGVSGRWDMASNLEVKLYSGELSSADDLTLFSGANAFCVENPNGEWEIFQAADIELIAPSTYRLSRLLRGQLGSEHAIADPLPIGSNFVHLNDAVIQPDMTLSDIGLDYFWHYGPADELLGSEEYTTSSFTFSGVGLRPYSPVHLVQTAKGTGDHSFTWIRRSRIGGDSWSLTEIPLGEDTETYAVDVIDGADQVVRTFELSQSTLNYLSVDRIADLGSATAPYSLKVCQVSSIYGRGTSTKLELV